MLTAITVKLADLQKDYDTCSCPFVQAVKRICVKAKTVTVRSTTMTLDMGERGQKDKWKTVNLPKELSNWITRLDEQISKNNLEVVLGMFPATFNVEIPEEFLA